MTFLSVLELFTGLILIIVVLHDVFQSVVVPRWTSRRFRPAPWLVDAMWRV